MVAYFGRHAKSIKKWSQGNQTFLHDRTPREEGLYGRMEGIHGQNCYTRIGEGSPPYAIIQEQE